MKKFLLILAILAPVFLSACCSCETEPIVEENHKPNVNMIDGMKEVLKNKYFWMIALSQLFSEIFSVEMQFIRTF